MFHITDQEGFDYVYQEFYIDYILSAKTFLIRQHSRIVFLQDSGIKTPCKISLFNDDA